jgi:hypothetical protein
MTDNDDHIENMPSLEEQQQSAPLDPVHAGVIVRTTLSSEDIPKIVSLYFIQLIMRTQI